MKKYFLITFTHQWNEQQTNINTDVIDIAPIEWLLKWHSGESDDIGAKMYYNQHLVYSMEITKEEYDAFKEKYS